MKRFVFCFLFIVLPVMMSAQDQFSVYFETNKYELQPEEITRLNNWISENATSKILAINGYTDEDGSVGLNDTLSQNRVSHVFNFIKGKVTVREDFKTRSFGKLHKQEAVKAKNRKATIYYLVEKDLAKENEILGIKEEPKAEKKPEVVSYPEKIKVRGAMGKEEVLTLDPVFMKQVGEAKAGQTLRIPNLNFYENTFAVMPDSRPRLYELLYVLNANPGLKIKLQGHVCCMSADRRNLSTQRAKAVMMFLFQNGIDKSRLSFEGFGVSKPLYAIPEKSPEEREANRRVEVLITENTK